MKKLLTMCAIALATTTLAAAAPGIAQPADQALAEAPAPDAQRLELARRFVALSNPESEMISTMRDAAMRIATLSAEDDEDPKEQAQARRQVDMILTRAEPVIRKGMPRVLEAYVQAYAREFTAEELTHMLAFAQTPAGRHYIAKATMLDLDAGVLEASQELGEGMRPVMEDVARELCAEKAQQRIAMGDKKAKCPLSDPDTAQG